MLDRTDKKILEFLQKDSRISNQDLADAVALSPSPCSRRVKILEDEGVIQKYVALLNPKKLGLDLTILVSVGLDGHSQEKMAGFEKSVSAMPEVIQCYLITGQQADYLLKVVVTDLAHYQTILLNKISRIKGVSSIHSSFVLRNVTDTTALPLNHL